MYKINTSVQRTLRYREAGMSDDGIRSWIRRFAYDPDYKNMDGTKAVPMTCFCEYAGVSRAVLYRFLSGDKPLSAGYRLRLTVAINAVSAGLRWFRMGDHTYRMNDPDKFNGPKYERMRPHELTRVGTGGMRSVRRRRADLRHLQDAMGE